MSKLTFNRERGAAMVEFAIVLPLLVTLVFGIIEFGRAYNAQISLTHAAREGAREYAITQDVALGTYAAQLAASPSLDWTQITVTMSACDPGQPATVYLEYPFELRLPFFSVNAFDMTAQGVMRCGG
jgi:Flp pilus assembly protein TadG